MDPNTQPTQSQIPTPMVATPAPAANLTPTNQLQYAGFGRRLAALFVDFLSVLVVTFIFSLFLGKTEASSSSVSFGVSGIPGLVLNLLITFYIVFSIGKYGQTLGKKILKIKVVKAESGDLPGFGTTFLREIVGKFCSALVLLLGYFWVLWDPKKQGWHDKIAKTIVVRVQ